MPRARHDARAPWRPPALEQRLGAALVCAEPPAAARRLVHRAAHQGVAEAEATGHVRLAHEIECQQLIERVHRDRAARARGGGGELGVERVARDRRPLEHQQRVIREQPELLRERRCHDRRHVHAAE